MSARRLILIPTEIEASHVQSSLQRQATAGDIVERCGFGVVAAAARAVQAIVKHQPSELVLVGIAGTLAGRLKVGDAYEFSDVVCYGIGVGCGADYRSAGDLGWHQWEDAASDVSRPNRDITDRLALDCQGSTSIQLLTCCAASSSEQDVQLRCQKFPEAAAEDMEGFAVAAAGRLTGVKVRIIRGISNVAGQRNPSQWKIAQAMQAAVGLLSDS